jgi:hypothetical protein
MQPLEPKFWRLVIFEGLDEIDNLVSVLLIKFGDAAQSPSHKKNKFGYAAQSPSHKKKNCGMGFEQSPIYFWNRSIL